MVTIRLRVRTVDLAVESGARVLCLFGPSGAGKTTCLEAIAGLLRPDEGTLAFGDRVLFGRGVDLPPRDRRVGYVPQDAPLFPHLSVRRNLLYGAPDADPGPLAEALGITEHLDRAPRRLSGGERRRVALGRAVLRAPEILLLDEPFAGLDAPLREQLLRFVARLDVPHVVLVSHDPRDALGLADEVVRLEAGRAVERGAPQDVFGPVSPLVEPATLWHGRVVRTDEPYADVVVPHPGGAATPVHAYLPGVSPGEEVRLALRADEVTIALGRHDDLSARNQLPARIERLEARREQTLAVLDAGPRLFALLDPRSVEALRLEPGGEVVAQFKASALRRAGF